MDKLAKQLKDDAASIDVQVSDDFERRMAASLAGIEQDKATPARRPAIFWWASSLTGAATALLVVAFFNSGNEVAEPEHLADTTSPVALPVLPAIDLNAESAMLTRPLEKELKNLKSDLETAEKKVREDIGF